MAPAEAGAELREPHFDGLAVLTFARGLGFGQRLRLVGRTRRTKTVFRELVRRGGATQIRLGRVLFRLAQNKIARGKIGVNFSDRGTCFRRCRCLL